MLTPVKFNALQLTVPVSYGEEDMPAEFPGRTGATWAVTITLHEDGTAQLKDWPGPAYNLCMKVHDAGRYALLLDGVVVGRAEDYVPLCLGGDDYVELVWDAAGNIQHWRGEYQEFFPAAWRR